MMRLQSIVLVLAFAAICSLSFSYSQEASDANDQSATKDGQVQPVRPKFKILGIFNFESFKERFGKTYRSLVEELVRQKIFLGRAFRALISRIKYKHFQSSHYLSVNPNSDETPEERQKRFVDPDNFRFRSGPEELARSNSHIEVKPVLEEIPVANIEDIERELEEIKQRADEPDYHELANELDKLQTESSPEEGASNNVRRKREISGRREREIAIDDLLEPSEESVSDNQASKKILSRISSNNPNYEQPELSSSASGNDQANQAKPISESVLGLLSSLPGADYVKSVVRGAIGESATEVYLDASELPDEVFVDLRETGCFFQPRRQGSCGSCWAFTAIAMYEFLFCKDTGNLVAFSEQFMVDCGGVFYLNGCEGGNLQNAALFVDAFGLELRLDYPYRYTSDTCPYGEKPDRSKTGYVKLRNPETGILRHEYIGTYLKKDRRPIMFPLKLPPNFSDYGGGVADGEGCGAEGGHGMLLIGHGREDGKEYYLFRNSHSVSWGEQGYYKFDKSYIDNCAVDRGVISKAYFKKSDFQTKNPKHGVEAVKNRYAEYVKKGALGLVKEIK